MNKALKLYATYVQFLWDNYLYLYTYTFLRICICEINFLIWMLFQIIWIYISAFITVQTLEMMEHRYDTAA